MRQGTGSETGRQLSALGRIIIQRMRELGIQDQAELARRAGTSDNTVSRTIWRRGEREQIPERDTILGLADALGMDPVELVLVAYGLDRPAGQQLPEPVRRYMQLRQALGETERKRLDLTVDTVMAGFSTQMRGEQSA